MLAIIVCKGGANMKYENAKDILPDELLKELQKYAQGKIVYIPISEEKKQWGETSGYKDYLEERNSEIKNYFANGVSIEQLAESYCLSIESIKKIVYSKKRRNKMTNEKCEITQKFDVPTKEISIVDILNTVYRSMEEKGYDPVNQIVGYLVTDDPAFITNHNNARSLLCQIDRDELLRVLVRGCLHK